MFIITRRVRSVYIFTEDNKTYATVFDHDSRRPGIMGIRVGKIKEGFVVYCGRHYEIFPWNTIHKIIYNV
jgi:hypothetical protein